jgi:adenine-specific DNA glycosylase
VNDALLERYAEHRHDVPLRRTSDPYTTLVSEPMLEQTQLAHVVAPLRARPGGNVRPKIVNRVGVEQP